MIPIACPLLGVEEEKAIQQVLESGQLSQSGQVATFEQRFAEICRVQEAVAVSSGTAALHLALLAHGIGPGDEVITTPFSFAASANVILLVGATPVFVDIEPETCTIDATLIEPAITFRTRAILPVHLYGHPCDMRRLEELARIYDLALIEDACQAHVAAVDGKPVGSFGTGCFSFYPTKNMTTGEGGMVTTNDPEIAERVRLLRSHGQRERYRHVAIGQNLRMTEMQAALGLVQLGKLERFTEQRIANAAYLSERLGRAVQTPITRPGYRHVYHQYVIRVPAERDEWAQQLRAHGIATAIHYPVPIHLQPFYREHISLCRFVSVEEPTPTIYETPETRQPVAEQAAEQVLSLPVHPALSRDDLDTIASEVLKLAAGCVAK